MSTCRPGTRSKRCFTPVWHAAIGVSNFTPAHLRRLIAETTVVPAVNQIQLNPQIPRSTDTGRLRSNLEVFDFELTAQQMQTIDGLAVPGAGVDPDVDGH